MLGKIKGGIGASKFFYLIIAVFILQSIYFAASIRYQAPPDEKTHFTLSQFYASQPLFIGPFRHNTSNQYITGDIRHASSYLYPYLLSFPLKVINKFTSDVQHQVFLLRLISVALGAYSLIILRKLLRKLKTTEPVNNLTILLLSFTGMFIWLFASINYDVLAIPLFFLFLLSLIDFIQKKSLRYLLLSTAFAMFLCLTKQTFLPVVFIAYLILVVLNLHQRRDVISKVKTNLSAEKKFILYGLIAANLLFAGLFIERYGVNIIEYHSLTPSCTAINTYQECLGTPGFKRDVEQKSDFAKLKAEKGSLPFSPLQFTAHWIEIMYERLYFYTGQNYMVADNVARNVFGLTFGLLLLVFLIKPVRILRTNEQKFIALVTVSYIVLLFLYNLNSYLAVGAEFGFQGRYLLPVLAFIFLISILEVRALYVHVGKYWRHTILGILSVVVLLNIYVNLPLLVFIRGSDAQWYTQKTTRLNLKLQAGLRKLKHITYTLPHGN